MIKQIKHNGAAGKGCSMKGIVLRLRQDCLSHPINSGINLLRGLHR